MHTLIVVSHPDPNSLTHAVAAQVAEGVSASGPDNSYEIANLSAENFNPTFMATDIAAHLRKMSPSADVIAEQERVDRADALVLVYPVYWWSMPGLLKGWIDRVFSNGWAYDDSNGKVVKKLRHLRVHLVALGGADMRTYGRRGYSGAMKLQIDQGIFDYCGAKVATSELLLESDPQFPESHFDTARSIGRNLFVTPGQYKTVEAA